MTGLRCSALIPLYTPWVGCNATMLCRLVKFTIRALYGYIVVMALIRPMCATCNKNPGRMKGRNAAGIQRYTNLCSTCWKNRRRKLGILPSPNRKLTREERRVQRLRTRKVYRKHLRESCERCGFTALFPCQLDVDHIDEDYTNNDPSNLQTLCANCHRLITYLRKYPHLAPFV